MIPKPPHNRKLGLLGVALTKQRENPFEMQVSEEIQDEIERLIEESKYLDNAPFSWVTIAIRHGIKYDKEPSYQKISKKYGDLPLSIEIDTHETIGADKETMKSIIKKAVLTSLIHAGRKYNLSTANLEKELNKITQIPK